MKSLRNISVGRLFRLDESEFQEYYDVLKNLKGHNHMGKYQAKELDSCTYGQVTYMRKYMHDVDGVMKAFEYVFCIESKKLLKVKVVDFFHALNWINCELKKLTDNEAELLGSEKPDPKLQQAGIDRLNIFGELNILFSLAEKYSKTPEEIEQWPYSMVFTNMLHSKISAEIKEKYIELNKPGL